MESYCAHQLETCISSSPNVTITRQGDWICLNCNNLNFSFRQVCNRCKVQTRQNNYYTPMYSYFFYNNHMANEFEFHSQKAVETSTAVTPPKRNSKVASESSIRDSRNRRSLSPRELPSISPLLEKYRSSKIYGREYAGLRFVHRFSQGSKVTSQSTERKLEFDDNAEDSSSGLLWSNIQFSDQECQLSSSDQQEHGNMQNQQLERIIAQLMK